MSEAWGKTCLALYSRNRSSTPDPLADTAPLGLALILCHWGQIMRAALVSTLLSVGTEAGSGDDESELFRAIRRGSSDSISQTGRQLVGRSLDVQPTMTIRPGFPVRVIITRDLVLEPYRG